MTRIERLETCLRNLIESPGDPFALDEAQAALNDRVLEACPFCKIERNDMCRCGRWDFKFQEEVRPTIFGPGVAEKLEAILKLKENWFCRKCRRFWLACGSHPDCDGEAGDIELLEKAAERCRTVPGAAEDLTRCGRLLPDGRVCACETCYPGITT